VHFSSYEGTGYWIQGWDEVTPSFDDITQLSCKEQTLCARGQEKSSLAQII
jgi:hypothetical protein